ncbi:MAG: YraN family protein [Sedimentisphaerales bacterium]|nr:YraN family protein [Sedimentisphaerales bacterium]
MADPQRLGRWGERKAEGLLRRKGFKTIARNLRSRFGEIDLVMLDRDGVLVFVEVKTRVDERFQPVEAAVTYAKRQRIRRAVAGFLRQQRLPEMPMRCDVVAIAVGQKGQPQIRHYQGAFVP